MVGQAWKPLYGESRLKKILEIGAGSFRDVDKLNKLGVDCLGIDYSSRSIYFKGGSHAYAAPELFMNDHILDFKGVDIWAVCIILYTFNNTKTSPQHHWNITNTSRKHL